MCILRQCAVKQRDLARFRRLWPGVLAHLWAHFFAFPLGLHIELKFEPDVGRGDEHSTA